MTTDLVSRNCPLCGHSKAKHHIHIYDHMGTEDFDVVQCEGCQGLFLNPAPSIHKISDYYVNVAGDIMKRPPNSLFLALRQYAFELELRPLLRQPAPPKFILEIGTGDGELVSYLKKKGYESGGCDFYPASDWRFKNIPYRQADLNDLNTLRDLKSDAVIMRHVLEHVHEPLTLLSHLAAENVKYLLVIVPNVESPAVKWFGKDWCSWDPPRHLSFFTGKSLTETAARAGYVPMGNSDHGIDEIIVSYFRKYMGQWNRDPRRKPGDKVEREWWFPLLVPKGIPCAIAAALSAPFLPSVLSRVFVLKK